MTDLSQISDEAKEVLISWLNMSQSLSEVNDERLIEIAQNFTNELPIDSPVYILVTELAERLGKPYTVEKFGFELKILERQIKDTADAFYRLPIEIQNMLEKKYEP